MRRKRFIRIHGEAPFGRRVTNTARSGIAAAGAPRLPRCTEPCRLVLQGGDLKLKGPSGTADVAPFILRSPNIFMSLIHTAELKYIAPLGYLAALQRHTPAGTAHPADRIPWNRQARSLGKPPALNRQIGQSALCVTASSTVAGGTVHRAGSVMSMRKFTYAFRFYRRPLRREIGSQRISRHHVALPDERPAGSKLHAPPTLPP